MPRKKIVIKKQTKPKEKIIKEKTQEQNEIVSGQKVCKLCGKPATIISPKGNWFCCLACQTNYSD